MSAPETNIEKQKNRHFAPLMGMTGVIAAAIIVMLALTYMSDDVSDRNLLTNPPATSTVETAPAQLN
nr:hypothetical protein [Amylibacter sp.]